MENDTNIIPDIIRKFEMFRSLAETNQQKYKEAVVVLERLKEENNLSRDVEVNLRNQLAETQNRLIRLQENHKKYILLKERNERIEKTTYLLEEKILDLQKMIKENQEKTKTLMNSTSTEVQKHLGKLTALLKEKNADVDFLKREVKMLQNEKIQTITEYEEKLTKLQEELQNAKREKNETKLYCEKTLQMYRRQITDYEKMIKDFEREKNQPVKNKTQSIITKETAKPSNQDKNVTLADSTVSSIPEDFFNNDQGQSEELCEELSRIETEITLKQAESQMKSIKEICAKRNFLPKVKKDVPKYPRDLKQMSKVDKPQLDFTVSTSVSSGTNDSGSKIKKRRLFYDDGEGDFLNE